MKETAYVVKLGGKLYMQSEFYSFYPATTEHLLNAKFFDDQKKAEKLARKPHGTVIELHISDISERKEKILDKAYALNFNQSKIR